MKPLLTFLLPLISLGLFAQSSPTLSKDKAQTLKRLDELSGSYTQVAMKIWDWAELGYQEAKSSQLLLRRKVKA